MDAATIHPSARLEFDNQQASKTELDSIALISALIGSSCSQAVSEDIDKDEDNARWVLELEDPVQKEWVKRLRWIRLIDRFAENELIYSKKADFCTFQAAWQTLLETGQVADETSHCAILTQLKSCWFSDDGEPIEPASIQAWNQYVAAIGRYHTVNLKIQTFEQYEQMLMDLAGSFFQILPFLPNKYRQAASHFGVVDQFYNHLRDLQEDTQQGICYLPKDLLNHFGVSEDELLNRQALTNPNYHKMMAFWLDEYLPRLRRRVRPLLVAQDLHDSWKILCFWSIHRYRRIEQVFRECQFDYSRFSQVYWKRVQADMPLLLAQVKEHQAFDNIDWPYNYLEGWRKIVSIHQNKLRSLLNVAN